MLASQSELLRMVVPRAMQSFVLEEPRRYTGAVIDVAKAGGVIPPHAAMRHLVVVVATGAGHVRDRNLAHDRRQGLVRRLGFPPFVIAVAPLGNVERYPDQENEEELAQVHFAGSD